MQLTPQQLISYCYDGYIHLTDYPHPYVCKPVEELLTAGFPIQPQVSALFRKAA